MFVKTNNCAATALVNFFMGWKRHLFWYNLSVKTSPPHWWNFNLMTKMCAAENFCKLKLWTVRFSTNQHPLNTGKPTAWLVSVHNLASFFYKHSDLRFPHVTYKSSNTKYHSNALYLLIKSQLNFKYTKI